LSVEQSRALVDVGESPRFRELGGGPFEAPSAKPAKSAMALVLALTAEGVRERAPEARRACTRRRPGGREALH
jgi:hypothetical protein